MRKAARNWAAFAIATGVGLMFWSVAFLMPIMPAADEFISAPTSSPTASPSTSPSPTATPSATPTSTPSATPTATEQPTPTATPKPTSEAELYAKHPSYGSKFGTITLPSLKLSWPIFEGTSDVQLAKGVGHYTGSVLPGVDDNSILSGHRTTVFNRLGELEKGDLIYVKTAAGVFTYKVKGFRIVSRSDRTVIQPTETATLTLTTCYPFDNVGITTKAFIVTAKLVQSNLN